MKKLIFPLLLLLCCAVVGTASAQTLFLEIPYGSTRDECIIYVQGRIGVELVPEGQAVDGGVVLTSSGQYLTMYGAPVTIRALFDAQDKLEAFCVAEDITGRSFGEGLTALEHAGLALGRMNEALLVLAEKYGPVEWASLTVPEDGAEARYTAPLAEGIVDEEAVLHALDTHGGVLVEAAIGNVHVRILLEIEGVSGDSTQWRDISELAPDTDTGFEVWFRPEDAWGQENSGWVAYVMD